MDDLFEEKPLQGSIFPFLSVLCCVIGTMVIILIASSLNAAGFIDVAGIVNAIGATSESLDKLREKKNDLSKLSDETEQIARENGDLESLASLQKANLNLQNQKKEVIGRTANVEKQIAQIRAIPGKKKLVDAQRTAEGERVTVQADRDGAEKEAASAEARRAGLSRRRRELENAVNMPKTGIAVTGEGVEGEPFLIELAPEMVKVHSEGLSVDKGTEVGAAGARGEAGLLNKLAMELARPGNQASRRRFAVLLVRPGAIELHDEAERRMRRWRVPFTREPVEADWKLALE